MSVDQSLHASTDVSELLALTVRVPADLKRRFAAMCMDVGVSQQFMVGVCLTDALRHYDTIKQQLEGQQ